MFLPLKRSAHLQFFRCTFREGVGGLVETKKNEKREIQNFNMEQ